jgi:hypothetical protein
MEHKAGNKEGCAEYKADEVFIFHIDQFKVSRVAGCGLGNRLEMMISTRRFFARFSAELFGTTGRYEA